MSELSPSPEFLEGTIVEAEWALGPTGEPSRWSQYCQFECLWIHMHTIGLRPLDGSGHSCGLVVVPWHAVLSLYPAR